MNKLNVKVRDIDRKVSDLRSSQVVPGIIYGPSIDSTPVKVPKNELRKVLDKSGEVYKVSSKRGPVMVKFEEIQKDPVSREILHFSLVELPKGVETSVEIPIELKGTPKGIKEGGILVTLRDELTINAKPVSLPDEISVDISKLEIGDKITVGDLNLSDKIDPELDNDEVIAICTSPTMPMEAEAEAESTEEAFTINEDGEVKTQVAM